MCAYDTTTPVRVPQRILDEADTRHPIIPIDSCIADTVQALWDHGVTTLSSCCGHGKGPAALVLGNNENPERVASLLESLDTRRWEPWQWRNEVRARVNFGGEPKAAIRDGEL